MMMKKIAVLFVFCLFLLTAQLCMAQESFRFRGFSGYLHSKKEYSKTNNGYAGLRYYSENVPLHDVPLNEVDFITRLAYLEISGSDGKETYDGSDHEDASQFITVGGRFSRPESRYFCSLWYTNHSQDGSIWFEDLDTISENGINIDFGYYLLKNFTIFGGLDFNRLKYDYFEEDTNVTNELSKYYLGMKYLGIINKNMYFSLALSAASYKYDYDDNIIYYYEDGGELAPEDYDYNFFGGGFELYLNNRYSFGLELGYYTGASDNYNFTDFDPYVDSVSEITVTAKAFPINLFSVELHYTKRIYDGVDGISDYFDSDTVGLEFAFRI